MPARIPFRDGELAEFYDITEGTLAVGDGDSPGFPCLVLKCKKCPPGKAPREYEVELDTANGCIRTGDRNALLAHGKAHALKPTLRRRA